MNESIFFYTYSTIAQTLASAFGFLVAVVLYRIERIGVSIQIYEERRGRTMKNLERTAKAGPPYQYLDEYNSILKEQQVEGAKIGRLKIDLRRSLLWTAGTIMASIVILALTPLIVWISQYIAWVLVTTIVTAALYTIWTYTILALEVTK